MQKKTHKKIYISGQISNLPDFLPELLFEEAEQKIVDAYNCGWLLDKYVPVNPMKIKHKPNSTWEDFMERDIAALLKCDAIYILSNWANSRGARIEHFIALEAGLQMMYESTSIEVAKLVNGISINHKAIKNLTLEPEIKRF